MITKAFLDDFIRRFEQCKDLDFEWNTRLFEKSDQASFTKILAERSRELRRSFDLNEENIAALREALAAPLCDAEYRLIADAALTVYRDGYDDICVFPMMLEPCIEYFKSIRDPDYLLPLIHAYCFEYEQAEAEKIEEPKYSYEEIFAFRNEYLSISSRYARLTLFKSYSNVISRTLNDDKPGAFSEMVRLYREALSVWEIEEVQKLDGEDEEFLYFVDRMLLTITLYENISALTDAEREIYEGLIKKSEAAHKDDPDPMVACTAKILENYDGKISNEEIVSYMFGFFDELFAGLDPNGDPNEQEDCIDNCYNLIGTLCLYMDGERAVPSMRDGITERMNRLRLFVRSLPYTFFNSEMNRYVYLLYQRIRSFLSYEEKKEYLLEVVMFRQPITCIHSLMVESIAEAIGRRLLERRPDLFVGVMDTKTPSEVTEKRDLILSFIRECALFHDVGKVTMAEVINTQNRRLTDLEFKRIKTHPDNGLKILEHDPDFAGFFDVIRFHHRWYDGSAGYPDGADNTASPVRIVTDLVTVADCTDAATDVLGRNYARGKTFETVLGEFEVGAGTRYNPDIVAFIRRDPELIRTLTALTTENRTEIYKKAYSRYIN